MTDQLYKSAMFGIKVRIFYILLTYLLTYCMSHLPMRTPYLLSQIFVHNKNYAELGSSSRLGTGSLENYF